MGMFSDAYNDRLDEECMGCCYFKNGERKCGRCPDKDLR